MKLGAKADAHHTKESGLPNMVPQQSWCTVLEVLKKYEENKTQPIDPLHYKLVARALK